MITRSSVRILLAGMVLMHCSGPCLADATSEPMKKQRDSCGFPETVRDGLHPFQYYCLAKLYASQFKLKQARLCVEKLRACKPAIDSEVLAKRLEDTTLPKHPIPEEEIAKLRKACADKYRTDSKTCRELIDKYPDFEWSYFALIPEYSYLDESGLKMRRELMEKVLKINPHNVRALINLVDVAKRQQKPDEAFSYLSKAEKFYPEIVRHQDYFVPPTKQEIEDQKRSLAEANEREKKRQEEYKKNPPAPWVEPKYFFIDKSGKIDIRCGPNVWTEKRYSNGRLIVKADTTNNQTPASIQVWDRDGQIVFKFASGDAKTATEGLLAVHKNWSSGRRYSWGFVDLNGKDVVEGAYWDVQPVGDGMAAVQFDQGTIDGVMPWGFVDVHGNLKVEPIYSDVFSFSEGLATVSLNGKIGYIDKNGIFVIPPKFDLGRPFSEGLANVDIFDNRKRIWDDTYIDKKGEVLFHHEYKISGTEPLYKWAANTKSLSAYKQKFRLLMFSDDEYEADYDFHDQLLLAQDNDLYGFKNKNGKFEIEPKYKLAHAFSDGMAIVQDVDKYGFIDTKGSLVVPPKFRSVKNFSEGMASVSTDGHLWGYIDRKGNAVIPEKYLEANSFSEGVAKVGLGQEAVGGR